MTESVPDITLIILFHNAESTLERTLRSLDAQTLKNVEYLFVDDGSSDMSVKVLENFLALHSDFARRHKLVLSEMRRGTAHGTMIGLQNATGRYVMRCDADDYLDPDALRIMLDASDGGRHDVVIAPYYAETGKKTKVIDFKRHPLSLNDMAIDTLNFSLCNKLLRRKLLVDNDIVPYDGLDCWEDLGVVSRVMSLNPSVVFVDKPVYHYVENPKSDSLSRSSSERLLKDHLAIASLVEEWMVEHGKQTEFESFLNHLKFCAKVKMLRASDRYVDRWKKTFPEVNPRIMSLRHVPMRYRILFKIVDILPTSFSQWVADL